jgi:hypothetical protein
MKIFDLFNCPSKIRFVFYLGISSVIQLSETGMPLWKICAIFCRRTTRPSRCGLAINSKPSSDKAILAAVQVNVAKIILTDFQF